MFTIFLDVDGVLNKESQWDKLFSLDDDCIRHFAKIYETLKKRHKIVSVVLCSTWRAGAKKGEESPQYLELSKRLGGYGIKISDSTPYTTNKSRQQEIEYYVKRHVIKNYIVIDDDPSLYDDILKIKILVPDYKKGLAKEDVAKAKKLIEMGVRKWRLF